MMLHHLPSVARTVFVVALLSGVAQGQRGASAAPAFATAVLRSDSIDASVAATSPDGRWIMFTGVVRRRMPVWIMSAAGGTPHRLTSGAGDAWSPTWFPSSDRIAYIALPSAMVMTQAIDSRTGAAQGTPQRVTLDDALDLVVSPDGSLIAYTTGVRSDGKHRLQVVPARGGPARVVHASAQPMRKPHFAPDGQSIYVTVVALKKKPSQLVRVPIGGGPTTVVFESLSEATRGIEMIGADVVLLVGRNRLNGVTLRGDTLWSMPRPAASGMLPGFTADGKSMLLPTSETGARIRLVPVNGGAPRDITAGDTYDYPAGWSADGQRVYIASDNNGLHSMSVDGKHSEFIPFPADSQRSGPALIIGDGRFWAFPRLRAVSDGYLSVYDTKTRALNVVARSADLREVVGPGGYYTSAPALYYLDRGANGTELRSLGGDGQLRTVRRLSFDLPTEAIVCFANDRLAYWVKSADSAVLYVADHDRAPKRVYAFRGTVTYAALSFDGSALASTALGEPAGGTGLYQVMMLGITPSGALTGVPRSITTSAVWDLMWLRDNRSLLALENIDNALTTRVVKFTMDAARPVVVTGGEPMTFWSQYPSPDGRWTAIPVEKARGGTIWRIDLEAAAKAWQARPRK
jgi:Tol biopolymer transport system component